MKVFSTEKTGMFLDSILHKNEKRKGGEQKVIELTLRVQPFTSILALAMDEVVKTALYKRTSGEPANHVKSLEFLLPIPRQQLHIFASPDTVEASIMFDQVKISGLRARTEKGVNGYGFVIKATFGPVDKRELEFVEAWRGTQKFITFEEAEPSLDFADGDEDEDEDDDTPAQRPAPMFEDERDQPAQSLEAGTETRAQHKPISHSTKKRTH